MTPTDRLNRYRLCLQGSLDKRWLQSYESLIFLDQDDATTIIFGTLDQAALFGLLNRIRDMGVELIALERIDEMKRAAKGDS